MRELCIAEFGCALLQVHAGDFGCNIGFGLEATLHMTGTNSQLHHDGGVRRLRQLEGFLYEIDNAG